MYTCMPPGSWTVGQNLLTFGIQEFIYYRSVPGKCEHFSSKIGALQMGKKKSPIFLKKDSNNLFYVNNIWRPFTWIKLHKKYLHENNCVLWKQMWNDFVETGLSNKPISLFFSIQQTRMICHATVELVFNVMQPRPIIYEKLYAVSFQRFLTL
jgi:hypothetical protein